MNGRGRTTRRRSIITPPRSATKRPRYASRSSSRSSGRVHNNDNFRSKGDNAAYKRSAKKKQPKKKSVVKFAKKTKDAIKKVFATHMPIGHYTTVHNQHIYGPTVNTQNTQTVASLGVNFSMTELVHNIAVLFQGATPRHDPTQAQAIEDWQNWHQSKVEVISEILTYNIKNNSIRTLTLELYECTYKANSDYNVVNPYLTWVDSMLAEGTLSEINSVDQGTTGRNPLDNVPATLGSKPTDYALFRNTWSTSKTTITLEPGESTTHKMIGKAKQTVDLGKTVVNASNPLLPTNWNKGRKAMLLVFHSDIVNWYVDEIPTVVYNGRAVDGQNANKQGLDIELVADYKYRCPETIGTKLLATPVSGNVLNLNLRRNVRAIKVWQNTCTSANVSDVLENQPLG